MSNCNGEHTTGDQQCPKYRRESEVLKIADYIANQRLADYIANQQLLADYIANQQLLSIHKPHLLTTQENFHHCLLS